MAVIGLANVPHANAVTTAPPWQPGTSTGGDPSNVGTLTLYNATGQQITSGSTKAPVAAFIKTTGLTPVSRKGKTNASAFMSYATPSSSSNPGLWNNQVTSGTTADPDAAAPAPLSTATDSLVATTSSDPSINTYIANNPDADNGADASGNPTDTTGYDNVYEVRVFDTGSAGTDTNYGSADIQVNPVTNTWTQIYPTAPASASTTTAVTTSPASPQLAGSQVTLQAQVTASPAASAAGPGGTVQFFEDGSTTPLNSTPAAVNASGLATFSTTLASGTHTLSAIYTPASGTLFTGSTSPTVNDTVTAPDATATAAVTISPTSVHAGTSQTFSTTVTDTTTTGTTPAGTVTFSDPTYGTIGSTSVGSGGTASVTKALPVGSYNVSAAFTPTSTASFAASTSATSTSDSVTTLPTTSTALAVSPSGSATVGTAVILTSTTTPAVAGTVTFTDGQTQIGSPQTVSASGANAGVASVTTSTLSVGQHSFVATFVPTDPTAYAGSASPATAYTVTLNPTQTSLSVAPATTAQAGASVTLTSTTTESPVVAGSVQFTDGAIAIGSPQTVGSAGTASVSTSSLAVGTHTLTVVFTPTDPNYATSTQSTTYTITAIPTSTALSVSPTSPQAAGTAESLTAVTTPAGAGTTTFLDGATSIGSAAVDAGGTASISVVLTPGQHSLTAVFTPSAGSQVVASTSAAVTDIVSAAPVTTVPGSTTATNAGTGTQVRSGATGLPVGITVTSPNGIKGVTVSLDGGAPLALTAAGSRYSTTLPLTSIKLGTHTLTFTTTDGAGNVTTTTSVFVLTLQGGVAAPNKSYSAISITGAKVKGFSKTGFTGSPGGKGLTTAKKGSSISFTFYGNAIALHLLKNNSSGKIEIIVDGKKYIVDLYSAKGKQFIETISHLKDTKHSVQIIDLGQKNKASKGTGITVGYVRPTE